MGKRRVDDAYEQVYLGIRGLKDDIAQLSLDVRQLAQYLRVDSTGEHPPGIEEILERVLEEE